MTFRDRPLNPARDIGVGLAAVAVVCLSAAAVVARGGPTGEHAVRPGGPAGSVTGSIQQAQQCLTVADDTVALARCTTADVQVWTMGPDGSLRPAGARDECVAAADVLAPCDGTPAQHWHYDPATGALVSGTGSALAGRTNGWSVPESGY